MWSRYQLSWASSGTKPSVLGTFEDSTYNTSYLVLETWLLLSTMPQQVSKAETRLLIVLLRQVPKAETGLLTAMPWQVPNAETGLLTAVPWQVSKSEFSIWLYYTLLTCWDLHNNIFINWIHRFRRGNKLAVLFSVFLNI